MTLQTEAKAMHPIWSEEPTEQYMGLLLVFQAKIRFKCHIH